MHYKPTSVHQILGKPALNLTHSAVLRALRELSRADKAEFLPRFFQAYPGGYGEGDRFLGVVVPDQRKIAGKFRELDRHHLSKLLSSMWHEARLTGLLILVLQFERVGKQGDPSWSQREIVDFYLDRLSTVNNWDLVDCSAPKILGRWLLEQKRERRILKRLARSHNLWEQRVAVVATLPLIQSNQTSEITSIAADLLTHQHDLIHKAVGWMLREVGKQDLPKLRGFLHQHVQNMPRTMLRYAIEKMSPAERKRWLSR